MSSSILKKTLSSGARDFSRKEVFGYAGYKTPAIAKLLIDEGIEPVFPYTRWMTKEGFFRKHEYVYDEHYDCYICPEDHVLNYSTTNREGYREYKSCPACCESCPSLEKCTPYACLNLKKLARILYQKGKGYLEYRCLFLRYLLWDLYTERAWT